MARVLVVEDDPDILALVQARLRKAGYEVATASSGPDALRLIDDRGSPDLAVLDVGLPGMDGLELLDAIRSRPQLDVLPAVFLSGRVLPEDVARGREKGATYLTKPFAAAVLLDVIEQALARAQDGAQTADGS